MLSALICSVVQRPATFLMKMAISSFSMVPEPSLSNSLKQASKSSSAHRERVSQQRQVCKVRSWLLRTRSHAPDRPKRQVQWSCCEAPPLRPRRAPRHTTLGGSHRPKHIACCVSAVARSPRCHAPKHGGGHAYPPPQTTSDDARTAPATARARARCGAVAVPTGPSPCRNPARFSPHPAPGRTIVEVESCLIAGALQEARAPRACAPLKGARLSVAMVRRRAARH